MAAVSERGIDLVAPERRVLTPWRAIAAFGVVSLAADMVYEGARSITGPMLATLGASALAVGLITGAGEAAALLLRLVSGPLADRTKAGLLAVMKGHVLEEAQMVGTYEKKKG